MIENAEESRGLAHRSGPKIIIAGSGMSNGGRVHMHEQDSPARKNSTVLIVGYQAAGSLGGGSLRATKTSTSWAKRSRAKIETIYGYSAHMDSAQLLEFAAEAREQTQAGICRDGGAGGIGLFGAAHPRLFGLKAVAPLQRMKPSSSFK
jgi:metallo-beta-lactamase family protein